MQEHLRMIQVSEKLTKDDLGTVVKTFYVATDGEKLSEIALKFGCETEALILFTSGARSKFRELNAAAELGLLLGARNFVGLWHSTFSSFAQQRFLHRGDPAARNATDPQLICRCLRCCLSGAGVGRRGTRFEA